MEWQLLEKAHTDVNHVDIDGRSLLYMASWKRYTAVVQRLLQHPKIDVNQIDEWGVTAINKAARCGHIEIVKLLLYHPKIDVLQYDYHGHTPLLYASYTNNLSLVELLLSYYASQHPKLNVLRANWKNPKIRMLYLFYDSTLNNTVNELRCSTIIRAHYLNLKLEIIQHSKLYNDLISIIYDFACPSVVELMRFTLII